MYSKFVCNIDMFCLKFVIPGNRKKGNMTFFCKTTAYGFRTERYEVYSFNFAETNVKISTKALIWWYEVEGGIRASVYFRERFTFCEQDTKINWVDLFRYGVQPE